MIRHDTRPDTRAVSEVVGVILMVAITVLLASTAATLFLGFQEEADGANPSTAFAIDYDASGGSDAVSVSHASGDIVTARDLELVISDASATAGDPNGRYDFEALGSELTGGSDVSAGQGIELSPENMDDVPDTAGIDFSTATVRVVWTGSDRTATLQTWRGPDR